MLMKSRIFAALLVGVMATSSCIFDPDKTPPIKPPDRNFEPLTTRVAVLNNLELSYIRRNIGEYGKILDDGFTFFLSDGDVNGGLPVQWDRDTELQANTNLFSREADSQVPPRWPRCKSIDMDVQFENGNLQWIEKIPDTAPDEVWYTTTVFYDFQIEVEPDLRFVPYAGAKAQFTVRNAGTQQDPNWKLVEWRDLGSGN